MAPRPVRIIALLAVVVILLLFSRSARTPLSNVVKDSFGGIRPLNRKTKIAAEPYIGPSPSLESSGSGNGFMKLDDARTFCRHRRMDIYQSRARRRKVYDMFLFHSELDWLDIRLRESADQVDYFVILESTHTFQEQPKPLHLQANLARFDQYKDKIIHHVLNDSMTAKLPPGDTWEHERYTRNALFDQALMSLTGRQAPEQGDVLLVSDIDELPRKSTVQALRNCAFPNRVTLRSQMYYYSFQWLHRGPQWHHPQATYFNGKQTTRPESLRSGDADLEMYSSGWHCSSCFPRLSDLQDKIKSFSHSSYNQPFFLDKDYLLARVTRGEDLFSREGEVYDRIDNNPDIPTVFEDSRAREKYMYMLDRDPSHGNFQDLSAPTPQIAANIGG